MKVFFVAVVVIVVVVLSLPLAVLSVVVLGSFKGRLHCDFAKGKPPKAVGIPGKGERIRSINSRVSKKTQLTRKHGHTDRKTDKTDTNANAGTDKINF